MAPLAALGQIELAAHRHEGHGKPLEWPAVVLTEIRNGLEVRRQMPRQPDHSMLRWHSRSKRRLDGRD